MIKRALYVFSSLLLASVVFIWWASQPFLPKYSLLPVNENPSIPNGKPISHLVVMTYNIGHSQGIKADPTDWRDETYTTSKLFELAKVLEAANPDVALLQEIDLNSNRTHFVNQATILSQTAGFRYYACASNWVKNYLPFPVWPIAHHIGKVDSGLCILSKFPLSNNERLVFSDRAANNFVYALGYVERAAQRVTLHIGSKRLSIVNVHTEHEDKIAREKQTKELMDFTLKSPYPVVLGGDFNAGPNDQEIATVLHSGLHTDKSVALTFPSDNPNEQIDYIFADPKLKLGTSEVIQQAKQASDHLPIVTTIDLNSLTD